MTAVYRIQLADTNPKTGMRYALNFECEHRSVDELATALNDGTVVTGTHLMTRKGEELGTVEVYRRTPFALTKAGVGTITEPAVRFVEYEAGGSSG